MAEKKRRRKAARCPLCGQPTARIVECAACEVKGCAERCCADHEDVCVGVPQDAGEEE